MFLEIFKALVYTAVFSLLLTPFDFGLARAIGAIDIPADGRRMHTRPIPGLLSLKKSMLQATLSINCRIKGPSIRLKIFGGRYQVIPRDTPISIYNMLQTVGKI